ncbi:MAG: hypothetical protein IT260_05210 [Saprospiraceae bacterium]|nr:hypothetical protein [Saprospiraceae bacterium]
MISKYTSATRAGLWPLALSLALFSLAPSLASAQCAGAPEPSATQSTLLQTCSGVSFRLSLSSFYFQSELQFQWQASADNSLWADLPGAQEQLLDWSHDSPTWYRCRITCTNSGETIFSTPLRVDWNAQATYYSGSLPYLQDFENNWTSQCAAKDQPAPHWQNFPPTGVNSWRRNDDGSSAGWWDEGLYGKDFITTAAQGQYYARFHSVLVPAQDSGRLELYLDCSAGAAGKMLSFDFIDPGSDDYLSAWVSTDGGAHFSLVGQTSNAVNTYGWTRAVYPFTSLSPTTVLRIVAISDNASSDIGIDDVLVAEYSDCAGTPAPAQTLASTPAACIGVPFQLSLDQLYPGVGYRYGWQYSPDSLLWTPIAGAAQQEDVQYIQPALPNWYRCAITCANGSDTAFSKPVRVGVYAPPYYSGGLPFVETFETTWTSVCSERDVPALWWYSRPFVGTVRWSSSADVNLQIDHPAAEGKGLAILATTSGGDPVGDLSLFLDLSAGAGPRKLVFDYLSKYGFGQYFTVAVSTDGGETFSLLGDTLRESADWQTQTLDFYSVSAQTVLRFRGYIADPIYVAIDHVRVLDKMPCAGAPEAAVTLASDTAFCAPRYVRFTLDVAHSADSLAYQWQISYDSLNWVALPGASNPLYSTVVSKKAWYRCRVLCQASGEAMFSKPVFVHYFGPVYYAGPYPYLMDFESPWTDQCAVRDVPSENWDNFEDTARNSVRRNDDGALVGWEFPPYVAPGFQGNHFAAYKTAEVDLTEYGGLFLYLDCSGQGDSTWRLNFDYYLLNFGLQVLISKDGGTSYDVLINDLLPNGSPWYLASADFISASPRTVIFFRFRPNGSFWDLGIDNVRVGYSNAFGFVDGTVYQDLDGNCQRDPGEPPLAEKVLKFTPGDRYALTDTSGRYQILLPQGETSATIQLPPHHDLPCGNPVVNGIPVSPLAAQTVDFGLHPIPGIRDLEVLLTPATATRLGFPASYMATVRNLGTAPASGVLFSLDFPADSLFFTQSEPPGSLSNGHFETSLPDLPPGQSAVVNLQFAVPADVSLLGKTIALRAAATHSGPEATPANNQQVLYSVLTAAYDPNDKLLLGPRPNGAGTVLPGTYTFDYTIRFQNTGNDTAFTVEIRDSFDLDLEPLSFRTVATSHPARCSMSPQGHLSWRFDNILLPDSSSNGPASQGFVRFQIRSKALLAGDTVANRAGIYFDFNPPVLTNTIEVPVALASGTQPAYLDLGDWQVFPNPVAADRVAIRLAARQPGRYHLYRTDVLGRQTHLGDWTLGPEPRRLEMDVADWPNGVYHLHWGNGLQQSRAQRVVVARP